MASKPTKEQHKLFWGYTFIIRCAIISVWKQLSVDTVKRKLRNIVQNSNDIQIRSAHGIVSMNGTKQWRAIGKEKPYLSIEGQLVMSGVKITPDGKVVKEKTKTDISSSGNQNIPFQIIMDMSESIDLLWNRNWEDISQTKKRYII